MAQLQAYVNKRYSSELVAYLPDVQFNTIDLATRLVASAVICAAFSPPPTQTDISTARNDIIGTLDFLLKGV